MRQNGARGTDIRATFGRLEGAASGPRFTRSRDQRGELAWIRRERCVPRAPSSRGYDEAPSDRFLLVATSKLRATVHEKTLLAQLVAELQRS